MNEEKWAIIDDNGIIDSGTEEEIRMKWNAYVSGAEPVDHQKGPIRLVHIVATWN